jgi:hypothetical protein
MNEIAPDVSTIRSVPESLLSKTLRLGQKDAETGFSGWLVIFTGFLCILTGLNAWVLHSTDRILHEQAVARDRGWVLVDLELAGARFAEPADPVSLRIIHRNVGQAVVTKLTYFYEIVRPIRRENIDMSWESVLRGRTFQLEKLKCTGQSLPTILPMNSNMQGGTAARNDTVQIRDLRPEDKLPKQGDVWSDNDEFMKEKAKTTFVVRGCSEYLSIGPGRTEFCRYLDSGMTAPESWQIKECPAGDSLL